MDSVRAKERKICVLTGASRQGKTETGRSIVNRAPRAIVLDPKSQFGGGRVCETEQELLSYFRFVADRPRYKIIVRPRGNMADLTFKICMRLRQQTLLAVDEAHRWCSPTAGTNKYFREVMLEGGHRGCSILAISQRPQHLTAELRSFADVFLTYRLTKKRDRKELEDYIDDEAILQQIRTLQRGEMAWAFIDEFPLIRQYIQEVAA